MIIPANKLPLPKYLPIALSYVGLKEIPGPKHNTVIQSWLKKLGAWWSDDETPWCGVFMAAIMQESGFEFPKDYYRAKSWRTWGYGQGYSDDPKYGSIAILERVGGGHVGIVTAVSKDGLKVRLLGGNQANSVSEAWFDKTRIVEYRRPKGVAMNAPPIVAVGKMSESEA